MKIRGRLKRFLVVMLAVTLCVTWISGCGKGGESDNTTAKKEFVYVPEYQKLDGDNLNVVNCGMFEDNFYFIGQEYDEQSQMNSTYLCSMKMGEQNVTKTPLEIDGSMGTSVMAMAVKPDGNLLLLISRYPMAGQETGGQAPEDAEPAGVEGAAADTSDAAEEDTAADADAPADENSAVAENTAAGETETETGTAADNGSGEEQPLVNYDAAPVYELWTIGRDGKTIETVDLSQALGGQEQSVYIQYTEIDKEGNLYLADYQKIVVIGPEGGKLFDINLENGLGAIGRTGDGTVVVSTYGETGIELKPVDFANKKLGEAYPNLSTGYGSMQFARGEGSTFLFSSGNQVYSYDTASKTATELFNWLDADINSDRIQYFSQSSDGKIVVMTMDWQQEDQDYQLAVLTRKNASEVPEKKILTLGTMGAYGDLKSLVINFNKTNTEYRIEVKEYEKGGGIDSFEESRTRMNADIIGGNCPDIIDLSSGSGRAYMAKGILEDLNPYLEKDPEISREDYLENIMDVYQIDGKLYAMFPTFYIDTVTARTSDVGDKTSWTLDEMIEYVDSKPKDARVFQYASQDFMLLYIIRLNQDQYVNWNTGECNFNGEEFIKLLEFAARFPSQEEINYNADVNIADLLREEKVLLMDSSIAGVEDYQMQCMMYDEPITFIGYPTQDGQGSAVLAGGIVMGMSSRSKYKDGVWQFLRSYMTKEYQEDKEQTYRYGFPIMKSALEAKFEEAMTPEYYDDGNGNQVEQAKNHYGFNGFDAEIFAATQEDVDAVRKLIESVNKFEDYDMQLNQIVQEEAAPFFKGQKSAREVADIIQSRMKIYVNESR